MRTFVVSWKEAADSQEGGLRDAHELGAPGGRLAALGHRGPILVLEDGHVDELAGEQLRGSRFEDGHAAQHLADDDLDVLVVDLHALRTVDALDLGDDVLLGRTAARDAQYLLGVDRSLDELLADLDSAVLGDEQLGALGDLVDEVFVAVVAHDDEAAGALAVLHLESPGGLGDRRLPLGGPSLEEFLHARQALGDVVGGGRAARVEGAHRQLCSRLADRLGRDDPDGLADVHEPVAIERP